MFYLKSLMWVFYFFLLFYSLLTKPMPSLSCKEQKAGPWAVEGSLMSVLVLDSVGQPSGSVCLGTSWSQESCSLLGPVEDRLVPGASWVPRGPVGQGHSGQLVSLEETGVFLSFKDLPSYNRNAHFCSEMFFWRAGQNKPYVNIMIR